MAARLVAFAFSLALVAAPLAPALAQSGAASPAPANGVTPPADDGTVSATGQHMPDVGASKSAGVTAFDKKQERKMQKETTICKGC